MNPQKKTGFAERIAALSEQRWNTLQLVCGVALGGACIATLFLGGEDATFSFMIAVVLALFLPRWIEEKGGRPIMRGRIALCVTIAAGIAAMALIIWLKPGWIAK